MVIWQWSKNSNLGSLVWSLHSSFLPEFLNPDVTVFVLYSPLYWGWGGRCSCALQDIQQHFWPLPTKYQQYHFPSSCDNQKCPQVLPYVPWGAALLCAILEPSAAVIILVDLNLTLFPYLMVISLRTKDQVTLFLALSSIMPLSPCEANIFSKGLLSHLLCARLFLVARDKTTEVDNSTSYFKDQGFHFHHCIFQCLLQILYHAISICKTCQMNE